jgi:hypothetical protein
LLERLPRPFREHLIEPLPQKQHFLRLDFNVGRRALAAARRLVNHDARVRQRVAFAFRAGRQQERSHARCESRTKRRYLRLDELHRVVDRKPVVNGPAWRIDIKKDVLVGVLGFQKQHLRDDQAGGLIVDGTDQKHDPLAQEPRINVISPLASTRLFDDGRYELAVGVSKHGALLAWNRRCRLLRILACGLR